MVFSKYLLSVYKNDLGRVRILIKTRLKLKFDRFTMDKMSNFIFNRVLMSIRTRPWNYLTNNKINYA